MASEENLNLRALLSLRSTTPNRFCSQVSSFFYENENFVHIFEMFVETNAHKIDLDVEEMKLE